jgi:hypothetical protein
VASVLVSSIVAADAFVCLVHELAALALMPPDTAALLRVLETAEHAFDRLDRVVAADDFVAAGPAARHVCGAGLVALHVIAAYPADASQHERLARLRRMTARMIMLAARLATRTDLAMLERLLPSDASWPAERARASA